MDGLFYGVNSIVSTTWATRNQSPFVGERIRCTDIGNREFYWNGIVWLPIGSNLIGQSAVASSITGTTSETTLASITIPGGIMGSNGVVRVTAHYSTTNNANAKNLFVRFGGSVAFVNTAATSVTYVVRNEIRNRNALNSQVSNQISSGATTLAAAILSINTAVDQILTITGQLANTGDTITLEGYSVEVLPS